MKTSLSQQYIVDNKGHRRAVVLDLETYEQIIEDMSDLKAIAERKNNPKIKSTPFVLRLKKYGIL